MQICKRMLLKAWRKARSFQLINKLGIRLYTARFFYYDYSRFIKYAGLYDSTELNVIRRDIAFCVHCLEKGLTMPEFRYCFGGEKISKLAKAMVAHRKKTTSDTFEYRNALKVLNEYLHIHKQANVALPDKIQTDIAAALGNEVSSASSQPQYSAASFWEDTEKPFPAFAASRHSVRHLSGAANEKQIHAAIELARTTPTACNRQFIRSHFINNHALTQKVLQHHSGSAGFGHTAEQLIVITGKLSAMAWAGERNEIYLNAGLFCMNLSYALHYNKVAHCILNWQVQPGDDEKVRNLLNIDNEEEIAVIIICGRPADNFKSPESARLPLTELMTTHAQPEQTQQP